MTDATSGAAPNAVTAVEPSTTAGSSAMSCAATGIGPRLSMAATVQDQIPRVEGCSNIACSPRGILATSPFSSNGDAGRRIVAPLASVLIWLVRKYPDTLQRLESLRVVTSRRTVLARFKRQQHAGAPEEWRQ